MSAVPSSTLHIASPVRPRHLHLVPTGPSAVAGVNGRASGRRRAVLVRRRFAALVVLLMLLGGATLAAKAFAGGPTGAARGVVTVRSGETLSDIAARELPSIRTDRAVVQMQEANHLDSMHVDAGQTLIVPAP